MAPLLGYPKYQVPYCNRDAKRDHNFDNHPCVRVCLSRRCSLMQKSLYIHIPMRICIYICVCAYALYVDTDIYKYIYTLMIQLPQTLNPTRRHRERRRPDGLIEGHAYSVLEVASFMVGFSVGLMGI